MTTNTQAKHDTNHLEGLTTMAAKIRYLATVYVDTEGTINRGRIAAILGIKYQWVRNVLITPVKG
jgi:phage antirepressor YoqD-like protein